METMIGRMKEMARRAVVPHALVQVVHEELSFLRWAPEIERRARERALSLHLGCGPRVIEGWINADMIRDHRTLTLHLPQGLRRFKDASVGFIYASHVLEHIAYPGDAQAFVKECHRILRPGGAVRIIVPSIDAIIAAYAQDDAGFFDVQREFHPAWCTTKLEHLMYALQQDGEHKYGFDMDTITKLFHAGHFQRVERSNFNQSRFPGLRIDYRGEVDNHGRYLSLYVDAVKD
jgi:predicted SAM-dependent methyltransferase